ncbi:MAG: glycosyltransferase family 1 protein [Lachnospiraceae bacterium]|nr:glycosyltransferase family 1 protein [Lachnospiraceae bacterium]
MKKIILFSGGVETLEYFSRQIGEVLASWGYKVFTFDLQDMLGSFMDLVMFCEKGEAVMITFNFMGISGESVFLRDKGLFFDEYGIKCINIVVDHPFYYHKQLARLPKNYIQFCIDRTHLQYMKRYFPKVKTGGFLPLAGTEVLRKEGRLKAADRKMDIIFTGNYTPPETFNKQIDRLGREYSDFYHGIIDDLTANTDQTMEEVFERHIKADIPEATDKDLKKCMENMIFLDLYVRFYMRGKAVKTLADNGFKVHVFGSGFERIPYKKPENIIFGGRVKSIVCLRKLAKARVSLNVMPWFKDGAHDRVFSAALNGAVNLTDGSRYLHEIFSGAEDVCFYELGQMDRLPELAERLLSDYDLLDSMAERAYDTAKIHTWAERTKVLERYISSD